VLSRGREALSATDRRDRFAETRLREALSVAMELALAIVASGASGR
jgi:hypothetical protein